MRKSIKITNRRASYDYEFIDTYNAGIVLFGDEVKSIRNGNMSLSGAYCYIDNGEVWIKNSFIKFDKKLFAHAFAYFEHYYNEQRPRKLLLTKKEIRKLKSAVEQKGYTIIPYCVYTNEHNMFKCEIKLAKGKHNYDKRESIKEKDLKRCDY